MSIGPISFPDPLTDPDGAGPQAPRAPATDEPADHTKRLRDKVNALVTAIDTGNIPAAAELIRDTIGLALVAGANVTITPDDAADSITIAAASGTTDPEVVRDTVAAALRAGTNVTITVDDVADTITIASTDTNTTDPEVVRDTVAAALRNGQNVTIVADDAADTITITAAGQREVTLLATASAWTDQPAAETEWRSTRMTRCWVDLTNAVEVRFCVSVHTAGVAGAQARLQYSTDQTTWAYFDGTSGPLVPIDAVGAQKSAWVVVPAAAKADVVVRVVGINGDGVADPLVCPLVLQVR